MLEVVEIIDSDPNLVTAYWTTLWRRGFAVFGANSEDEGLHLLKTLRPKVLILEIRVPGPPGVAFLRKVRDLYPLLPIICMTSHSTSFTEVEAIREGADGYFVKPFDPDRLVDKLVSLITGSRDAAKRSVIHPAPAAMSEPLARKRA